MKIFFHILIFFLFVSCTKRSMDSTEYQDKLQYTFLGDEQMVNPLILGIWKSIGNGYYLEARKDSILLYSYTESFCYKEKNDYLEGLLNSQGQFILSADTISIYLTDYGDKTKSLQSKKDFVRVEEIPESCMSFLEMTQLNPPELFSLYMETITENYAFSKERSLDWKKIKQTYEDSISDTSNTEKLFSTLGEVAALTKDHHTKVINENGRTLQYRGTPSAILVQNAFNKQSEVGDLNDFFNLFFQTNAKNITDSLLQSSGEKVANGNIEWGSLNEDLGYIKINAFAGFAPREYTRLQQIDSINYQMTKILGSMATKKAIIIDIGFNFGGYDASGFTIASYFTGEPVLAYVQEVYNNGDFYCEDSITVEPADSMNYTKPVYVLMTDISRSAAESFAMMMGALPNVKLVGTSTLGILSGMLGKSIGGFYTTFSNQRLVSVNGQFYEVKGVKPDIELKVFRKENVFQSHKIAVRDLMQIIEKDIN